MKIGIQTWGTEGDVRPFFALARELGLRGHDVRVVYTSVEGRDFSALARDCGVRAASVGEAYFVRNKQHIADASGAGFAISNPMKQLELIFGLLMDPVLDPMLAAAADLVRDRDLLVAHFLCFPMAAAAMAKRRKLVGVAMQPVFPTRRYPPTGLPDLGGWLNPLSWRVVGAAVERIMAPRLNAMRARSGLPPLRDMQAHATDDMALALVALSPTLLPRPDDWHPRIHVSGFLGLPASAEQWTPEPGLQSFLDAGEPPLFLSFGSMLTLDDGRAAESVGVFAEALELAGARGVVQAQASVIANAPRSARIHYLERAPHAQLFPRCAAVVHHGGAGTTQSALLAGKPSVIVPHAADQFFFADLLHARGCASKPLKRNALAPKALAARVRRVLDDPTFAAKAKAMGEALAREDGARHAADLIEASAS